MNIPLIAIIGPTATGKSALAVHLAELFLGEIMNADSRQVYRGMDIGTGKPTPAERARIPHHLLDIVDPDEEFNVALYASLATREIISTHTSGRLPLLVGGSGHYVWAVLEGLKIPQVPPDVALREALAAEASEPGGHDRLMAELAGLDPLTAGRIDSKNLRRVIRAIEVSRATGRPFSEVGTKEPPPYRSLILGLTAPRPVLYRRIDDRVDEMIEAGWLDEVRTLLASGLEPIMPSYSSLGYRELAACLRGEHGLSETIATIKTRTHEFARRQYSWFKPADQRIHWLDITQASFQQEAMDRVQDFLRATGSALAPAT